MIKNFQEANHIRQGTPMIKTIVKAGVILTLVSLTGCSSLEIKPWVKPYERQNLADSIMSASRHPIANMHVAHVLDGREAARGGEGSEGGGCGCN
jgi:hypothetical protein